jgi:hypothetical protein
MLDMRDGLQRDREGAAVAEDETWSPLDSGSLPDAQLEERFAGDT